MRNASYQETRFLSVGEGTGSSSVSGGHPSSNVGSPSLASANALTTGMMERPLAIRAAVLRRPEFFPQKHLGDDLVEESDLLYPALKPVLPHLPSAAPLSLQKLTQPSTFTCAPVVSTENFGLQPVLCLPPSVENYYEGEFFKAILSVVNVAPYSVREVEVEVDGVAPSKARLALAKQHLSALDVHGVFMRVVELPLREEGKHLIEVKCRSVDPAGHQRDLSWNSVVNVSAGVVMECLPTAHRIPVPVYSPVPESVLRGLAREEVYGLEIFVKNCTSSFLTVTSCFLDLHPRSPYRVVLPPSHQQSAESVIPPSSLLTAFAGAAAGMWSSVIPQGNYYNSSVLHTLSIPPGEKVPFLFLVALPTHYLRRVPIKSVGSEQFGVITSTIGELGTLRWSWQRHRGDGGGTRSGRIWLSDFIAPPSLEVLIPSIRAPVTHAYRNAGTDTVTGKQGEGAPIYRAGSPMKVTAYVLQYSSSTDKEVQERKAEKMPSEGGVRAFQADQLMVKIRPEKLAPDWLYGGPNLISLQEISFSSPDEVGAMKDVEYCNTPTQHKKPLSNAMERTSDICSRVFSFSLSLVPWRAGDLIIPKGALEIVFAGDPQRVLWPATPRWKQEKGVHPPQLTGAGRPLSICLEAPSEYEPLAVIAVI